MRRGLENPKELSQKAAESQFYPSSNDPRSNDLGPSKQTPIYHCTYWCLYHIYLYYSFNSKYLDYDKAISF